MEMVTSTSTPGSRLMEVYDSLCETHTNTLRARSASYDLLHDLAGGVEVDQTLVDLELVAIPGLGTLTARLDKMDKTFSPC